MRKLLLACGIVLSLSLIAVPTASADTFLLNDIYCNCLPAGSTAGGTVTVQANGNGNVTFTVALNTLLNFHYSNAFDLFAFNFTGDASTLSLASITPAGWTLSTTALGAGSMDGAGHSYDLFIDCLGCSATGGVSGVSTLTFQIHSSAGTLTAANFELTGGNNNDFAASVTRTGGLGCTGVIGGGYGTGNSTPHASSGTTGDTNCGTTLPDGGTTAALLGSALLGLGFLRLRFGKR